MAVDNRNFSAFLESVTVLNSADSTSHVETKPRADKERPRDPPTQEEEARPPPSGRVQARRQPPRGQRAAPHFPFDAEMCVISPHLRRGNRGSEK